VRRRGVRGAVRLAASTSLIAGGRAIVSSPDTELSQIRLIV
jgi:hypothetical protein